MKLEGRTDSDIYSNKLMQLLQATNFLKKFN